VRFTGLRIQGFKSFVDPTAITIEHGLTGIVGPNGCGKSNLVEALSWVMGESSAKRMRGGGMDDVIFGGTSDRPSRNVAEVVLTLDNSDREAPAAFNDNDEITVSRRIERGSGSTYRINGREVRARDVHLLFADAASGNRSGALVRQGQIAEFIEAKPTERRLLLEEAAGITGLHSRRHEAELRLRAAESNLERLDDVIAALEEQLGGLKRQARQASRYRNLSSLIRSAEARLLYRRWQDTVAAAEEARAGLKALESGVAELTREAAAAAAAETEAAAGLPDLRRQEAEAAARLQRLNLARESLEAEEARLEAARGEIEIRLAQIAEDDARETDRSTDAAAAIARLEEERAALSAERNHEGEAREEAVAELDKAEAEVAEAEAELARLTQRLAVEDAERATLIQRIAAVSERLKRHGEDLDSVRGQRRELEDEARDKESLGSAEAELQQERAALVRARARAEEADAARGRAEEEATTARTALQTALLERDRLAAEEKALAELLAAEPEGEWPPLIDELDVEPGFEAALGAALGDDLIAPQEEGAPVHWRSLPAPADAPGLPDGVASLARFVRAPASLARRLRQIGVVEEPQAGRALQAKLAQGQRLVSRGGALWRWDGFTIADGASTAAAVRLRQRNRRAELAGERQAADVRFESARDVFEARQKRVREAAAGDREAREALRTANLRQEEAHDRFAERSRRAAAAASRLAALTETATRLEAEMAEEEREAAAAQTSLEALGDGADLRRRIAAVSSGLAGLRRALMTRQSAVEMLAGKAEAREARLRTVAEEIASWTSRLDDATRQIEALSHRRREAEAERDGLDARPRAIAEERGALFERIEESEGARREAADRLAEAENRLAGLGRSRKEAEERLSEAREDRVRREAQATQAEQARASLAERIFERLECTPDEIAAIAGLKEGEEPPDGAATERRLERLLRERDNMGPVNLRAESEARELAERIESMQADREDLVAAIARLRQGISSLNREGRQRLLAAFEEVSKHFGEVFQRLFSGGKARLEFIESEDPLQAGLEILASPPGKRPQTLSLLSGGEQALTALSLLFAVFLTNPAPICVLDEVEASLDDANVDRFCSLLEDIAHHGETRFLLISHHRMTMARMDRLYGVTMAERGVSQLVSVDLRRAVALREAG
jgi:chromosome segregation protein